MKEPAPQSNPALALIGDGASLGDLAQAAEGCTACELYREATQVVFGAGRPTARLMLVGEQPGDAEDRQGAPFVGPAGALLDDALGEAGIPRAAVYLTNVVKHFRWKPGARKRLHQKPSRRHIEACLPWFEAEIELVAPSVIVCLGATAAQALLGRDFRVTQSRGEPQEWEGNLVVATVHPAAALRAPDAAERRRLRKALVEDLRTAFELSN